ncbi:MAG: GntR family transcriptional regulator [Acutalibacteraceae bacterium]|nr:GntR family transcriptional regulator [Acutalibacteraceae bacterium]
MLQLNYKSGVPICDQIVNGFIRMKALGLSKGGDQLPSVRQLALELCVNPNTIQKAYQMLESAGVIYSVKGKGSFFSDDAAADIAVIKAAKKDFRAAVQSAVELGMTKAELKEIVEEICCDREAEK